MGFFDFIGKAVRVVKDFVVNHADNPIIKGIESVAGVVAHAIPGVGPVIDAAIPALQAIFSDGSPPPPPLGGPAPPQVNLLDQPFAVNLRQNTENIDKILNEVTTLKDTLTDSIRTVTGQIDDHFRKLIAYHRHDKYITFKSEIKLRTGYFQNKKELFSELTASSGPSVFNQVFYKDDGSATLPGERKALLQQITLVSGYIEDPTWEPSQDMVNLYLMGVHWLLIFDKAVIVLRGLQIKSFYANKQYARYLHELASLKENIEELRHDAKNAVGALQGFIDRMGEARDKSMSVTMNPEATALSFNDNWNQLSIGWLSKEQITTLTHTSTTDYTAPYTDPVDGDKAATPDTVAAARKDAIEKFAAKSQLLFYQEVARRNLEVHLMPCQAVVDSLKDNLRQWIGRLPVSPAKLPNAEAHVLAAPSSDIVKDMPKELRGLVDKEVRYAVTYVNAFGESPPSDFTNPLKIAKGIAHVKITVHPVVFKGDPTAGIPPIKVDGEDVAPEKGIRRRIYIQYKMNDNDITSDFVGELNEKTNDFHHGID